ncbi:MAG: branched-chain amino acid ABC transporter permease [Desulfobacterales bacterium]|nr:branched-chain amino acid ABC transporter permease [Desulfobacterales bacterium]
MLIELIDVLISGITNGSVYALMAIGMALVYGVTKVFNFAYGSFYSMGGYLAFTVFGLKFGYFPVLIIAVPLLFLAGFATEVILIKPLRHRADWEMAAVMVTLGLAMFLDNTFQAIYGPFTKSLPALFTGGMELGPIWIGNQNMAMFVISIVVLTSFMLFLSKTRLGMAVEAVAQDMDGAQIVGIPINVVFGVTFAVSALLAGLGGILLAPKYFVSPFGGWDILVKAWVITALGGMGSIRGSLYAAFILGIIEAMVGYWIGFTWILFAWFAVLLTTLIIRPQGLFGTWG